MALTNTNKGQSLLDDPEGAIDDSLLKSEEFVKKNQKGLTIAGVVILLLAGGFFFYKYQNNQKNTEAQEDMYNAVYFFEADSLNKALNGNGKDAGFLDIAEDYGSTKAGNMAKFYIGVIYLKQGKFDDAIESLKDFSSNDLLLQARAYALIGDAHLEKKNLEESINFYSKASDYHPNDFFTPRYLLKLALVYELNNDYGAAVKAYDKIINEHFKSNDVNEAKKLKALAEQKAGNL